MAEFLVTTLADEDNGNTNGTSLREAIQFANTNGNSGTEDVITFATGLEGGTITLTLGSLVITEDLRIDGDTLGDTSGKDTGRADDITITTATIENHASGITVTPSGYTSPGQVTLEQAVGTFGDFRIFEVRENGTDAAFNALTLTGAGVYEFARDPLLPSYGASGAAIYQADFEAGTTRSLPDKSGYPFTWNEGSGDIVPNVETTVTVTNSEISDNFGGAIVAGHRFTIEDSILSANHGGFAAGIIITAVEGQATIRDVHIIDHDLITARATLGTGAPGAEFIVEDSVISHNRIVDTNVGGSLAVTGAGVFFSGSPGGGISITGSVVSNNQGILAGAITTGSPDVDITILNSVLENNIARSDWLATFGGGAIALAAVGADVYIEGSSLVGNKNVANGGGAVAIGGTSNIFEIVNSTLTGNVSGKSGGAIGYQGTSNKTSLVNSTVVDNHVVENPITDLNGLTPHSENALANAKTIFPEFGSTGGLYNILSYEQYAFNGGDNQTRIENSIIAGNTNLGVPSDVYFELGFGDAIDFLTDSGFRFDPNTGHSILDPEQTVPPAVENYDLVVENSLIGAGFQSGTTDDFNDDGINPSTNIIGTPDAPVDPMLAAATIAGNGQTILTPLPDSPVVDAGDNSFVDGVNTAPQGTVGGLLVDDIAGAPRIADGDGEGNAQVDMGAVEMVTPLAEAVYYVGDAGRYWGRDSRDDYGDVGRYWGRYSRDDYGDVGRYWGRGSHDDYGDVGRYWGRGSHDDYGDAGRYWGRDSRDDYGDVGRYWGRGSHDDCGDDGRYWGHDSHDVYRQTEDGVSLFFDGSDVLRWAQIDGLDVIASDQILLSFTGRTYVRGLGNVDDSDIVLFKATSLGQNTTGSFEMYFDGSDVGLRSFSEDVDGFSLAEDGSLLLSIKGDSYVKGVGCVGDEDVLMFKPTSLGKATAGSFEMYFDGSDVGLGGFGRSRDVDAVSLHSDGNLLLSTAGKVYLDDAVARHDNVVLFAPTSLGATTAGSFSDVGGSIFPHLDVPGNLGGVDFGAFDHDLLG